MLARLVTYPALDIFLLTTKIQYPTIDDYSIALLCALISSL